jgi:hypothetical protein
MGAMTVGILGSGGGFGGDEGFVVDDAAGLAVFVEKVRLGPDAAIDDGDADAFSGETAVLCDIGEDGGAGRVHAGGDFAVGGDVFDPGVGGEGGEGGAADAGGEGADDAEFGDGAVGAEVDAGGGREGGGLAAGAGFLELDDDVDGLVIGEVGEVGGEFIVLGPGGGGGEQEEYSGYGEPFVSGCFVSQNSAPGHLRRGLDAGIFVPSMSYRGRLAIPYLGYIFN